VVALCAGTGRTDRRVLRGGSFNNNRNNARCTYRNRNKPNNNWNNNGFRIVVSHVSPCLAGNVPWLRLGNRGFERWPDQSLAEP
jgi:hypothetical protein